MTILRVEQIVCGVEDISEATRFCSDFGLELVESGQAGAIFRTLQNQLLQIVGLDETGFPAPVQAGVPLRELTWGVDSPAGVEAIAVEMSKDRDVEKLADGIRVKDESGYSIAFRVAQATDVVRTPRPSNLYGRVERWNDLLEAYGSARPNAIAHVVLELPKEGREKAISFYTDRLHFKPTDIVVPTGPFLQCEGNVDHHQLFLLHRSNKLGLNHISFEVNDFDELIEGGNFMVTQGWKEVRRLGRHTLGSNMYRFFHSPLGCRFEYAADMDKVAKSAPTRIWEEAPPHHIWTLKTNAPSD